MSLVVRCTQCLRDLAQADSEPQLAKLLDAQERAGAKITGDRSDPDSIICKDCVARNNEPRVHR